jgi:hypothetical protein
MDLVWVVPATARMITSAAVAIVFIFFLAVKKPRSFVRLKPSSG